jgi:hypothetical protein
MDDKKSSIKKDNDIKILKPIPLIPKERYFIKKTITLNFD